MKTHAKLILATGLMILFTLFSCSKADPFKVGTHVAAKWSDGNYWGATILGNTGGKYQIRYDDGTSGEVMAGDMKSIIAKEEVKAGAKVLAVWSTNGRFYPGTVESTDATGATVKWDDGSSSTHVDFANITK